MLRRFENFKVGALDARRLNEMVDTIIDLQRQIDRIPKFDYSQYGPFLARIVEQVDIYDDSGNAEGNVLQGIDLAVYRFEEVAIRLLNIGLAPGGGTSFIAFARHPEGSLSSRATAQQYGDPSVEPMLVDLGATEFRYGVGDIVPCFKARIDTTAFGSTDDSQYVYVISGSAAESGALRICTITEAISGGMYKGELNGDRAAIEIENLYETQDYYGAANVTLECASLVTGQRLPVGSDVWAMKVQGRSMAGEREREWVTMTPVPFGVDCTCGDLGQPLTVVTGTADKDAVAAGIISRIMGGSV